MSFLALLLGAVATLNPFVGLILTMVWCGYVLRIPQAKPLHRAGLIFLFPVLAAIALHRQQGILLMSTDAIWGVGLAMLAFLLTLSRKGNSTTALTNAAILIILYGIARHLMFGSYLNQANDQTVAELGRMLPNLAKSPEFERSVTLMRKLIPASWTVPQLMALFLGYIFFLSLVGTRLDWKVFALPRYYNLLVMVSLPLYFFPQTRLVFINTLISLCVLPLAQGIGVIAHFFSRLASNLLGAMLITALVLFNLVMVALLGFADIWLDLRKIYAKGNYS